MMAPALVAYNILLGLFSAIALPCYALQAARKEKYRAGLAQRLGFYPASLAARLGPGARIWVHAVSVGEVVAALPLIARIRGAFPGCRLILSTVTLTGQKVARDRLGDDALIVYFPLDCPFSVRRALRLLSPSLIVLVETEIWPNFISAAARRGIPIAIVNGRISDRSFPRYRRVRFLLKPFLGKIAAFGMQTGLDAERIKAIGAPPGSVRVSGNMKFDCMLGVVDAEARRAAALRLGLCGERDVIVAGSTHPGEEEIILDAAGALARRGLAASLVIVPRHPERAAEVAALAVARGARCVRKSRKAAGEPLPPGTVLVVDTVGELVDVYRAATVVFVGKSLTGGGGQNIIEPACLGKAVIFGPSMHNFREAAEILLEHGGAVRVGSGAELEGALASLLGDRAAREEMGRRAAETMAGSSGATERNLALIRELLED